ncbi:MAG: response regulator [Anaerolineae bacterium]|nr:response regulator [Anaerolineae bacterium]
MLLKNKRIFVIEDDAANLAIACVFLRQQGATVYFERWGYETPTQLCSLLPIDVILLDLMFPNNVNGYDLFDAIRAHPDLSAIPIVAVTSADPDREMIKVRERGFNGFISKPISPIFPKYIAEILNGKAIWLGNSLDVPN